MQFQLEYNNNIFFNLLQTQFYQNHYKLFYNSIFNSIIVHLNIYCISICLNIYQLQYFTYRSLLQRVFLFFNKSLFQKYKILIDIATVDFPGKKLRFQLNYFLLSLFYNTRIIITTYNKEIFPMLSLSFYNKAITWIEREVYDLFGIVYKGQKDLRRILTDYAFKGYPLRKDFPLSGYYELNFNDIIMRIQYVKIILAQEYRTFSYNNPWVFI
jgi:NADH:ubiquinone oxidoreductase subunit C